MRRRTFIKNTAVCTGVACLGVGIYGFNVFRDDANNTLETMPSSIVLESCTLCQLSCPECWRTKTPNKMPLGYLKFEDFKSLVDKNSFIKHINLTCNGEMLLNPDLNKIIKYAQKNKISLSANSGVNLNTITDETAELLVTSKFGEMVISIDGASQETYSVYRRGGDFNKVIENIKKIQFYQKKHNDFEHPKLVWKFIVFGHNEHEIPKVKQYAKNLGLDLRFDINSEMEYSPIKDIAFVERETGLNYGGEYKNFTKDVFYKLFYDRYLENGEWFYCTAIFKEPTVFYDGKFMGCCMGLYDKAPNINVFETGLKKALQSKEIKKISNIIQKNESSKGTMCEGCDILRFLKDNNIKLSKNLKTRKVQQNVVG